MSVEVHDGLTCGHFRGRHMFVMRTASVIAIFLAPRPEQVRLGTTRVGVLRDEYNANVEGSPPRFVKTLLGYEANPKYMEWTQRADTWAREMTS